jgi:hypothetical protein
MTMKALRPRLRRRLPFVVLAVGLFALSVVAVFYNPIVGAIGIVRFCFAADNTSFRLSHPRSYATELGAAVLGGRLWHYTRLGTG